MRQIFSRTTYHGELVCTFYKVCSASDLSASQVNPSLALGTFVPHFSKLVLTLTESDDVATEELLDDELLFSLLLLSEVGFFLSLRSPELPFPS